MDQMIMRPKQSDDEMQAITHELHRRLVEAHTALQQIAALQPEKPRDRSKEETETYYCGIQWGRYEASKIARAALPKEGGGGRMMAKVSDWQKKLDMLIYGNAYTLKTPEGEQRIDPRRVTPMVEPQDPRSRPSPLTGEGLANIKKGVEYLAQYLRHDDFIWEGLGIEINVRSLLATIDQAQEMLTRCYHNSNELAKALLAKDRQLVTANSWGNEQRSMWIEVCNTLDQAQERVRVLAGLLRDANDDWLAHYSTENDLEADELALFRGYVGEALANTTPPPSEAESVRGVGEE